MVKIIAEIGINHNGNIDLCKEMIKMSSICGVDYVKIQKRNPDICIPEEQKYIEKNTPWGVMSYIDYKKKIEFNENQIKELVEYSNNLNINFFASVWDKDSVDIMSKYSNIGKIGSACITDTELCVYAREKFKFLIISTGMSSEEEIEKCVNKCKPDVIMHTNSTYPCDVKELNLNYIIHLKNKYSNIDIGYSGHEYGLVTTFATIPLGVSWIERHITVDRTFWGSDQKSSIEPHGLYKLVKGVRDIEKAFQYKPQDRILFKNELIKRNSLRLYK